MTPDSKIRNSFVTISQRAGAVVRWLGSLKLTIALLLLLAAVLAYARFLEATRGRECAQWYVYGRPWFIGLLCVLAANIAAATLTRRPWRWNRPGLVLMPVGLLVLLAGFIQTLVQGIEGRLHSPARRDRPDGHADPSQSVHAAVAPRPGGAIHRAGFRSRPGRLAQRSAVGFRRSGRRGRQGAAVLPSRPLPAGVGRRRSRTGRARRSRWRCPIRKAASWGSAGVCPSCLAPRPSTGGLGISLRASLGAVVAGRFPPTAPRDARQPGHPVRPLPGSRLPDSRRWQHRPESPGGRQRLDGGDCRVLSPTPC